MAGNFVWAGGEDSDFATNTAAGWSTTAGHYDSTRSRGAMVLDVLSAVIQSETFSGLGDMWCSWQGMLSFGSANDDIRIWSGSNSGNRRWSVWIGAAGSSTATIKFCTSDGTTDTVVATSTLSVTTGVRRKWTVALTNIGGGASGNAKVYWGDDLLINYTGTLNALSSTVTAVRWSCNEAGVVWRVSECQVADEDNRLLDVITLAPSGAGAGNTWTSAAYGSVDETQVDYSDLAASDTANQVFNAALANLPSTNFTIKAVRVAGLAAGNGSAPTKLTHGLRSGGTDYFGSAQTLTDALFEVKSQVWTTNPATSAAFTASEVNSLELAEKSET